MKKAAYVIVIVGLLLIINSLIHSIYNLWQKQDLVTNAQKKYNLELAKNQKIKAQFQYAQTPQFLEEQAHDKLFMTKPGETQVLFSNLPSSEKQKNAAKIPNWQQWIDLFL